MDTSKSDSPDSLDGDWRRILQQRSDPFESNDINEPRYVWDAAVHKFYLNSCSFYLLRFRELPADPFKFVKESLSSLGVASFYIYLLFGQFDAIIRVWATPSKLSRVRAWIRKSRDLGRLLDAREFQAEDGQLMIDGKCVLGPSSSTKGHASDLIQDHLNEITSIAKALNQRSPLDQIHLDNLVRGGFVHVAAVTDPHLETFRFVSVLLPEPSSMSLNLQTVTQWLAEFHDRLEGKVVRAAVYKGIGYGDFLISGTTKSYETLVAFSELLREKIGNHRVRTETYLNATKRSVAVDHIDPEQTDLDAIEERMVRYLGENNDSEIDSYHKALQTQSQELRNELQLTYRVNELQLVKTNFDGHFRDFLAARIRNDPRRLAVALNAVLEIEGILTDVWIKSWKSLGYHKEVSEAAKLVNLDGFDPKLPTFKNIIDISRKLRSLGKDDLFSRTLGEGWENDLEVEILRDVRNDIAHGRVFVKRDYLDSEWSKVAEKIGKIGALYNRARLALESSDGHPDGHSDRR